VFLPYRFKGIGKRLLFESGKYPVKKPDEENTG
jgi:hypothetical protein